MEANKHLINKANELLNKLKKMIERARLDPDDYYYENIYKLYNATDKLQSALVYNKDIDKAIDYALSEVPELNE